MFVLTTRLYNFCFSGALKACDASGYEYEYLISECFRLETWSFVIL